MCNAVNCGILVCQEMFVVWGLDVKASNIFDEDDNFFHVLSRDASQHLLRLLLWFWDDFTIVIVIFLFQPSTFYEQHFSSSLYLMQPVTYCKLPMLNTLEHATSFVCILYLVERLCFWCKRGWGGRCYNKNWSTFDRFESLCYIMLAF